jgi:hypothetical protein
VFPALHDPDFSQNGDGVDDSAYMVFMKYCQEREIMQFCQTAVLVVAKSAVLRIISGVGNFCIGKSSPFH